MKKVILLTIVALLIPYAALADRKYSSGAELQSATSAVEWQTTAGTLSIDTTTKRSGSASVHTNPTLGTGLITHRFQPDTVNNVFIRAYLYIASAPLLTTNILVYGDGSFNPEIIKLTTTRTLQLFDSSTQVGSDSAALSLNTWYCIEMSYNDTTSAEAGYVDAGTCAGTSFASGTGSDIGGGGVISVGVITAGVTADLYWDDIGVNNSTNTVGTQTGLLGEGRIVHLVANAAGDNVGETGDCTTLDEVPPTDNDADDVTLEANTSIVDCNIPTGSTAGLDAYDTITFIGIGVYIQETSAGTSNYGLRLKSAASGTVTSTTRVDAGGSAPTTNPSAATAFSTWKIVSKDPTTLAAWTLTGTNSIENAQVGVDTTDGVPDLFVDALWTLIEYVNGDAPAGGTCFHSGGNWFIKTDCYVNTSTTTPGIIYISESGQLHCINGATIAAKQIKSSSGRKVTGTVGCKFKLWKPI